MSAYLEKLTNASFVCEASSRVGLKTSTRTLPESSLILSIIGRANAAVLPVPVCAVAMTSRSAKTGATDFFWISVGVL